MSTVNAMNTANSASVTNATSILFESTTHLAVVQDPVNADWVAVLDAISGIPASLDSVAVFTGFGPVSFFTILARLGRWIDGEYRHVQEAAHRG